MIGRWWLAMAVGLVVSFAPAQAAGWRFRWQAGQVLTYKVEQVTNASEEVEGTKVETSTKMNNVKRWQVLNVDNAGVGTLQLSLTALRIETTTPKGETLLFDSANREKSDPQMWEQLSKYVGQPLAVLRVDGRGQVVEVKESKHGPASRFEAEPPFIITLPDEAPKQGEVWERGYRITVEPPDGTGEKYDAVQQYACKSITPDSATLGLKTQLKTQPQALADRIPLFRMLPEGEVIFDTRYGYLRSARTVIEKELTGHQGEGSSYRFKSTYTEEYVSLP
ncbi:MAG TPA: hypothetical protein VKI65_00225 [Gemmataceae bacterium]|nr:hypothetical protein [Gemmataceae bacterium]